MLALALPSSAAAAAAPAMHNFPSASGLPLSVTVGADGNLWYTTYGGVVERMTPSGHARAYKIPHITPVGAGGIAAGSDGALWFDEDSGQRFGRITTSGRVSAVVIPRFRGTKASQFIGPVQGPDGNIWFAAVHYPNATIGRIDSKRRVSQWWVGIAFPETIVSGPSGRLWFTGTKDSGEHVSGSITMRGRIKLHHPTLPLPPLTVGPDDNFWSLLDHGARRTTPTGSERFFSSPPGDTATDPVAIAPGPGGDIWFLRDELDSAGPFNAEVGTITSAGDVRTYPVGDGNGEPVDIVAGPDGNIWITQFGSAVLTRVTPSSGVDVPAAHVRVTQARVAVGQLVLPLRCSGLRGTFCSGSVTLRAGHRRLLRRPARFTVAAETRLILRLALRGGAARELARADRRATLRVKACTPVRGCHFTSKRIRIAVPD